jgi:hypothetical protein
MGARRMMRASISPWLRKMKQLAHRLIEHSIYGSFPEFLRVVPMHLSSISINFGV